MSLNDTPPDPAVTDPSTSPVEEPVTELDVHRPQTRGRSRSAAVGLGLGVVALLAAGTFAVVKIAGGDDEGGAASPAEVADELVAALNEEDFLGVVDLLLPSERDALRDPVLDMVDDLRRLQVLTEEATLEDVGGLDIQMTATATEEPTNAADITNVVMSGTSTVSVDGEQVPIGSLLVDRMFDGQRPDMDQAPETEEFQDVRFTTVERDGRWYLSAFYTAAEAARDDREIPASGIAPAGMDEPQLAVDEMIRALAAQDIERAVALMDPSEAEALQRYAPLFMDEAEQGLDDADVAATISNASYSVEGTGDRRSVGIDAITMTISGDEPEESVEISYADRCITVTMGEETTQSCGIETPENMDQLAEDFGLGDPDAATAMVDAWTESFADLDPSGIAVHEVDGQWYVSPMRTMFDGLDSVMDALTRDEIERVIDATTEFIETLFEEPDCCALPPEDEGGSDE